MRPLPLFVSLALLCLSLLASAPAEASSRGEAGSTSLLHQAETFDGLELRNIGPALQSGRIADIAIDPEDRSTWYVAVASGGVWKTENAGTTWTPVFDDQNSYSIGCVTIDPNDSNVVWVGTGENNSQRSAGWGDGVYKSIDGGRSWQRMGLETSEHIGKIVVDPNDSDVVWVAAQGPLWSAGGDRGLYKSTDGGQTWTPSLTISEHTGISDVVLDPRDSDVVYASSYQRRRRQWALIAGGPESGIHKSMDGGQTWRRLENGLPTTEMGRIGLALAPHDPNVLYAQIAAADDAGGFFVSEDRGEHFEKRSDYVPIDPQYYMEIFPDPHRPGRIYSMDVFLHRTEDEGRTWIGMTEEHKHVDNHALVFDPEDPDYLLVGCDGGIYESFDRGKSWKFIANLPITQFYRVAVDDSKPFYRVYGGTQDNDTVGGPHRTHTAHGIRNSDWFMTVGGDGYQTRVDPTNPDILYSLYQYGGLVRFDRKSGEIVDIQPQPEPGEPALRWNWDSPLVLSHHDPSRLYFAAQSLHRSDDRGNSWRPVSPDLTREIDRNSWEVMGRIWSVNAVWKNVFTSFYGSIVALDESRLEEGLLITGTDDGLIHIGRVPSDPLAGEPSWQSFDSFPGVPAGTYVSHVIASRHDSQRFYALFNNHKSGDFRPYALRSDDGGQSWQAITGGLDEWQTCWSIIEDAVDPDLVFLGTEFGLYFSRDRGANWTRLRGGMPTVAARDLAVHDGQGDLIVGTFGRGIYVLDDISPLRGLGETTLEEPAHLFPVRRAWQFVEATPNGWGEKGTQGHAFFTAENPPHGAVFTLRLKEALRSRHQARRQEERAKAEKGESVAVPSWDELREEAREATPGMEIEIRDSEGQLIRRIDAPSEAGFHRVAWDLRRPSPEPLSGAEWTDPWSSPSPGPLVAPGTYSAQLIERIDGERTAIGEARRFVVESLGLATLEAEDREALLAFQKHLAETLRTVLAAQEIVDNGFDRIAVLRKALRTTAGISAESTQAFEDRLSSLEDRLRQARLVLQGDAVVRRHQEPVPPGLVARVRRAAGALWSSTSAPTTTHRRQVEIAEEAYAELAPELKSVESELHDLGRELEALGAPWTPGRQAPDFRTESLR